MSISNLLEKLALLGSATIISTIGVQFNAQADILGQRIFEDTPSFFRADVFLNSTATLGTSFVKGKHWEFKVTEGYGVINVPKGQVDGYNLTISEIIHKIAPHGEPRNQWTVQLSFVRSPSSQLSFLAVDPHEPTSHLDLGVFNYGPDTPTEAPATTQYVLKATLVHVPEPTSTIGLLALGTLGAASTLKRKLKPSQSIKKETTKVG
ncbi:MAG: PEP-CTERM sorting domain-containing protein [Microcystis sp. LE18-22.4A]|jgi:hypothetical protein|uniref:PEP-CTERM sorting domain-containing protein n=1 Tax=Microcystis sp. LE18-22.4A TaxID=3016432 RepID=UPI0022C4B388|nr:PEP-CTERM sorting domain-containing protein [Microcystis sp. LE18-22.4A]MCZ8117597.1 PEP-CTERM sorting domain-containing protein [Microcystis sp. LE18-22.4A]